MGQGDEGDREIVRAPTRARPTVLPRAFGETVVSAWHLERPETARVLAELDRRIARSRQTGALVGPPGLGRTHLLHIFAQRIDATRLQCVYLPQARLDFVDLCRYCVASATGRRTMGEPVDVLQRLLHDVWQDGRSLLVMIDDADSMPPGCAEAWLELTIRHVPSLLSLFVTRDDASAPRDALAPCVAGLADDAPIVRFKAPMSETETCDYLLDRLSRVRARPETLGHFSEAIVEQLHLLSGGLPVRLHALAQVYLDLAERSPETARAWLAHEAKVDAGPRRTTESLESPESLGEARRSA